MKKILLGFFFLGTIIMPLHSFAESDNSHYSYSPETNKVEVKETGETLKIPINDDSFIELDSAYNVSSVISNQSTPSQTRSVVYTKVITITSTSPSFASTTYYSEYNNTFKRWYAGTLQFRNSKYQSGNYVATYSGPIVMQNW
ncbi:hypothetical protein [Enterococcus sp. BWR-S5]|uniref:hypothetical protein n=1 Tax=Enterococcus sp. BWR-S5 TaxID=2787714 RepID=UPI0019235014|nr:hypothetical protein [Enterococcus sp. BWR-S5]MBL1223632.1 hypothetical protein [Enterococcus sp. BWR-S5]